MKTVASSGGATATRSYPEGPPRERAAPPEQEDLWRSPFDIPERVGRYRTLQVIGSGGMGVVCTAYDPKLDRKVALKLLRDARNLSDRRMEIRRARLLREAQALAKLSHPNIVSVHDVDVQGELVYMAMELVEGQTLDAWIYRERRTWQEILAAYLDAARGLAAAHGVGITHRDFKPSNVLLGTDGRARVVDFGLAKYSEASRSDDAVMVGPDGEIHSFDVSEPDPADRLTVAGRCVGTPAYMSPEQSLGEPVGPASDQFSFAVALWEALYGMLPFGEGDETFWRCNQGRLVEPPKDAKVPRWLEQVLRRMLQPRIENRFDSMQDAIAALQADPTRRRRRLALASGGLVAALGVGGSAALLLSGGDDPCVGADVRALEVWNDDARTKIGAAFGDTRLPYAETSLSVVEDKLDAWTEAWGQTRTSVCEATLVHGEQSESLMDLRMRCLNRQLDGVEGLVGVLTNADAEVVQRSVVAASELPMPDRCASVVPDDADALPEDPQTRLEVLSLERDLARLRALRSTGLLNEYRDRADTLLIEAKALGHAPLIAKAALEAAIAAWKPGSEPGTYRPRFDEAVMAAAEVGDAETEARAWKWLLSFQVTEGGGDTAEALARGARAALIRADRPSELEVEVELVRGRVALSSGEIAKAQPLLESAYRLSKETLGPTHPRTLAAKSLLGMVAIRNNEFRKAQRTLEETLAAQERLLGVGHPETFKTLQYLGQASMMLNELERAQTTFTTLRARLAAEAVVDRSKLASLDQTLGVLALMRGDAEMAEPFFQSAEAFWKQREGVSIPEVRALRGRGRSLHANGRFDEAARVFARAIDKGRELGGTAGDYEQTITLDLACWLEVDRGDPQRALTFFDKATALVEKTPERTEAHPRDACRALALHRLGRGEEARAAALRLVSNSDELVHLPDDYRIALVEILGPKYPAGAELARRVQESYTRRSELLELPIVGHRLRAANLELRKAPR